MYKYLCEENLESKAVANLSASWKDFFFFFFFFFPTVYAGVDSFVLVSTSPCEGLSGWAAVQGEFWVIFLCDFSCLTVWSTEPDQDVNTLQFRRPLSRDELEAFGHCSQTNRAHREKKTQKNSQHWISRNIQLLHQCRVVPVLRLQLQEDYFSLKKTSPFFFFFQGALNSSGVELCLPVLRVFILCLLVQIHHCFHPLLHCESKRLFIGREIYLALAGGEGNPHKDGRAYTKFFTGMF